jgi:mannose-1-phosphate guanylyltransferase
MSWRVKIEAFTGLRMMNENDYVVIMAGGGGTRLWPLSRQNRPKQMLRLLGDRSFFQIAVDRLNGLIPPERILVVTTADQAEILRYQTPEIPFENFILEPMPRGTASVIGLAAIALRHRTPDAGMIILTADHVINNIERFQQLLNSGMEVARLDYLVTLGIEPTYPATGYGYIQRGEPVWYGFESDAFRVVKFKEKPDLGTAQDFIRAGDHSWNSGMFIWRVDRILAEFDRWMPGLYASLQTIGKDWGTKRQNKTLQEIWPTIQPETIDFGIMEKAEKVAVLPAEELGWSDVGSWQSVYDLFPANENGNILLTKQSVEVNSSDNLVVSENKERLVVLIGVDDLIVVDTPDALLVCRREDAQQVRLAVNQLRQSGHSEYL